MQGVYRGEDTKEIKVLGRRCELTSEYFHGCPKLEVTSTFVFLGLDKVKGTLNVQHDCDEEKCIAVGGIWTHKGQTRYILNVFATATPWLDFLVPQPTLRAEPARENIMLNAWQRRHKFRQVRAEQRREKAAAKKAAEEKGLAKVVTVIAAP